MLAGMVMTAFGICLKTLLAPVNDKKSWTGFTERENLHKLGGSQQRLATVEALLWKKDVNAAIQEFNNWQHEPVDTFIADLNSSSTSER
jgi:hypothetical protein